ncbi:hypothetical protein [Bogoriella caseilytica]|uniref:Uncharacterized protein n=1 Tax=Bogoriella caseilytica TaxID=56055 RepID=A0A3N2BAN5_9MICO|nr:hypothetical protein [Bogoriella caseilytica]ROR72340.1 hypothetical protein EDD31_0691 [Bogoriella caseilytica]
MVPAPPAPAELASTVLSEAFRDAGLSIRIEPGRDRGSGRILAEHRERRFVVTAWSQGFVPLEEFDFGHALLHFFDTIQQEVSQDQLWGQPLPLCGAHPHHPANAGLAPAGLELYCPRDRTSWTRLIPIAGP